MITVHHEWNTGQSNGEVGHICTACDHFLKCGLQTGRAEPVYYCEEFACSPVGSRQQRDEVYALPGIHENQFTVRKPEQARRSYEGLCRVCAKLMSCTHLKPGGGTWHCEAFEEIKA